MLSPPSLRNSLYYPVTSSVCLAAILATLTWWSGQNLDELIMNNAVWEKWQIWRAITATLLHGQGEFSSGGVLHLVFNLYWIWTFGTLVERVFGHLYCAAIFVLLALGSMLAQFAVLSGGVGLSGVGYGLWGMLWVLEKKDDRFRDAVDEPTSRMFVGWFCICVLLTMTNVMPVANVAHGVGAVMGVLLGLAICGRRQVQRECIAGLVVVLAFAILGSTAYWPMMNFSKSAEAQIDQAGLTALSNKDNARGLKLLERAASMRNASARAWFILGMAYQDTGHYEQAYAALQHASQMPDASPEMREVGKSLEFSPPPATNR